MTETAGRSCLELRFVEAVPIHDADESFHEPSGLALQPGSGSLWAISDDEKRLFPLRPDGRIDSDGVLDVGDKDFEGIAWVDADQLAVVRETRNEILVFSPDSAEPRARSRLSDMQNYNLVSADIKQSDKGKGLEGITVMPETGAFFVVKEGDPRFLLEISPDLSKIAARHDLTAERGFHATGISDRRLDVSGLCHDPERLAIWIVSDTGCCVFLYDLQTRRAISAPLIHGDGKTRELVRNAEGIALDPAGKRLFIVTDDQEESRLFTFEIVMSGPA